MNRLQNWFSAAKKQLRNLFAHLTRGQLVVRATCLLAVAALTVRCGTAPSSCAPHADLDRGGRDRPAARLSGPCGTGADGTWAAALLGATSSSFAGGAVTCEKI